MKKLSLTIGFSGPKDQEETITLGELFGYNPINQNSKIRLKVSEREGSYGSSYIVAEVEVVA